MKNFKKVWHGSLCFLDNSLIHASILIVLILYASTIFSNINSYVGELHNFSIVKLLGLLLIIYVSPKDTSVAILLAISYVVSLMYSMNTENFAGLIDPAIKADVISSNRECTGNQIMENGECVTPSKRCPDGSIMNDQGQCVEGFFPLMGVPDVQNNDKVMMNNSDIKEDSSCMKSYVPHFETVGDVCSPTATFKNELNAQGLNYPEGYNQMSHNSSVSSGSPL